MKNLILFILTLLISVPTFSQTEIIGNPPIKPSYIVKPQLGYMNTYNPPYLLPPTKPGNKRKPIKPNLKISNPMTNSFENKNPKQDSINAETLRLLKLYGQELANLNKPYIKDTTPIKLSIMITQKDVSTTQPVVVIDTFALSKQKRNGICWTTGGFGIKIAGTIIFINMYQPTEIYNNVRVTSTGIKSTLNVKHHSKENIIAYSILGGSYLIGGLLDYIGIDKLIGVQLEANGVKIPLFKKQYKK